MKINYKIETNTEQIITNLMIENFTKERSNIRDSK